MDIRAAQASIRKRSSQSFWLELDRSEDFVPVRNRCVMGSESKKAIQISRKIVEEFCLLQTYFHSMIPVELDHHTPDNPPPLVFALGQRDGVIVEAVQLKSYGGCGIMASLSSAEIARGMFGVLKSRCFFAGIARVGFFNEDDVGYDADFGGGLNDLAQQIKTQGLCLVSLGWTGLAVHHSRQCRPSDNDESSYIEFDQAPYTIVNPKTKGGKAKCPVKRKSKSQSPSSQSRSKSAQLTSAPRSGSSCRTTTSTSAHPSKLMERP